MRLRTKKHYKKIKGVKRKGNASNLWIVGEHRKPNQRKRKKATSSVRAFEQPHSTPKRDTCLLQIDLLLLALLSRLDTKPLAQAASQMKSDCQLKEKLNY